MSNLVLERIHQVIGNLVRNYNINRTYVDKDYQKSEILTAVVFAIFSTANGLKYYSPVQLVFGCDTIPPIKYTVD